MALKATTTLKAVIFVLAGLAAAPALAGQAGRIDCTGPFAADATEADVAAAFGADNVVFGALPGPEGSSYDGTTVFPDDPAAKLTIQWADEEARKGPTISIEAPSAWEAPYGIRIGMTLSDLRAINGAPFTVLGFGWDYGGAASFTEGALAPKPDGCVVSVMFALPDAANEDSRFDPLMGDRELSSDDALLVSAKPVVSAVYVGWPVDLGDGDE
ncbi:hypothetical protein [Prosthecomicrobium pneumaticum]|uniref:Uncharacterized protein n=1 Tax=Prosthecomicrobium pneumaticum TaxID=81895 RepID=A0A7W9CW60_9HYPH|nr:hypothetical protein [Prosthecomicrobium pneumaticum]MBB5752769.1 hypothetical protein [Prosthecomicrobium pneumaticum]